MAGEVQFEWTDYKGKPIKTEIVETKEAPGSPTEVSKSFLNRPVFASGISGLGISLRIITDGLAKNEPGVVTLGIIAGSVSIIASVHSFGHKKG